MLGKAPNALRNRIGARYEKNVLRIKSSLLTQGTLLAENLLPEVAALLLKLCRSMWCSGLVTLAASLSCVAFSISQQSGVVVEELNPLAAKVRSLNGVMLLN